MQGYEYDWRPCMQTMGIPCQCYPMMTMPEQQLEGMYPNIYNIINPVVEKHCDHMEMMHGSMHVPNKEHLEAMTDNILSEVEPVVGSEIEKEEGAGERQFGFGGRRLLRSLVGILLIRNLLGRRRRPFGFFPGFGFSPGFGFHTGFPFGGFSGF